MTRDLTVLEPFSYDGLSSDQAELARSAAERIRGRIQRQADDLIETGRDLVAVKAALGHGAFARWLDLEFEMSPRSAQRYMRAAEWAKKKSDIVADLEPGAVYLLSAKSTPEIAVADVEERIRRGERMNVRSVKTLVKHHKIEAGLARELKRKNEAKAARKRQIAREKNRIEIQRAEREEQERQETAEARAIVDMLLRELTESELEQILRICSSYTLAHKVRTMLTQPRFDGRLNRELLRSGDRNRPVDFATLRIIGGRH